MINERIATEQATRSAPVGYLLHPVGSARGQAQVKYVADALQVADQEWNAETSDEQLDRDYLEYAAQAVLEALHSIVAAQKASE